MGKIKISKKRKKFTMNGQIKLKKKPICLDPMEDLLNEELVAQAIWECLRDNDPEGVIEILEIHLEAKNKSRMSRLHNIPRTTYYHAIKSKNPTLSTLAKIVHAAVEEDESKLTHANS